jgi:glutaredoxin
MRLPARLTVSLLSSTLLALACGKDDAAPAAPAAPATATAPTITVKAGEKHLYRYFPAGGTALKTANSLDDVPTASREAVLVIPDGVDVPPGLAYVADLRQPAADGTYPVKVLTQAEFDAAIAAARPASPPAGAAAAGGNAPAPSRAPGAPNAASGKTTAQNAGKNEVIMFSTSWCGVCSQARRYFKNKGIDFVERDVEEEAGAAEEMRRRATEAGLDPRSLTGVPVIWVNGRMFPGFDPNQISRALKPG